MTGSTVMVNEWYVLCISNHVDVRIRITPRALSRDERLYSEASRFNPERHLTTEGKLKENPVFCWGFGR